MEPTLRKWPQKACAHWALPVAAGNSRVHINTFIAAISAATVSSSVAATLTAATLTSALTTTSFATAGYAAVVASRM